ncbi:MAG: Tetratricopeptide 2 repeat protein [Deltaproteobacteria bacterium]|nr:Tetratricopeptide 2 repeat protein [Deltaproteobacteria bacterium]
MLEDAREPVYGSQMKLASAIVSVAVLFMLAGCPSKTRNESVTFANEGTKAYGAKQWDTAIEKYKKATETWHDNHSAWYGLSASYAQRKEWAKAAEAAGTAVRIEPEIAMYNLMYGRFLYEKAIQQAKEDQAKKESKKVEEVEADLSSVNFQEPLQYLQTAIKLNNDLWRGHYLLGSIYRHGGKTKEAADEFSKALEAGPTEPAPWIALAELYRQWDYTDQAIQVAQQGTLVIPGENEKSEIWFELGMGYDDKRIDDKAIEAFDKALEAKKDNHKAKFARGQAYFRKGDHTKAKRDLEEFSKAGGASVEFFKQQASRMLMDIAAKSAIEKGAGAPPTEKLSPEDLVKKGKQGKGK